MVKRKDTAKMLRMSEAYRIETEQARMRKRRQKYATYDRFRNVVTDPDVVQKSGQPCMTFLGPHVLGVEFVYTYTALAQLNGIHITTLYYFIKTNKLARPIFRAKVSTGGNVQWCDVYTLPEVLVILKELKQVYSTRMNFYAGPESLRLNDLLESVRDELKRRIQ